MPKINIEKLFKKGIEKTNIELLESDKFHQKTTKEIEVMKNKLKKRSENRKFIRNK